MNVPEGYKACPLMICGSATIDMLGVTECDLLNMIGCKRNACAWYDRMTERCAVLSIARSIGRSK